VHTDLRNPLVILGGAGYTAGELLRRVCLHPGLDLVAAASESHSGRPIEDAHPHLAGQSLGRFVPYEEGVETLFRSARAHVEDGAPLAALVLALPHGKAMHILPPILEKAGGLGLRIPVVDISGDFRLHDRATYEKAYGREHTAPEILGESVYGLPELKRDAIRKAGLVANPGCFATAVLLALLPLAGAGLLGEPVAVSAYTGSSGAGVNPRATTHHPFRALNLFAYKPLAHQHEPEVTACLADAGAPGTALSFVTHSAPIVRGIYVTAHVNLSAGPPAGGVRDLYEDFYSGEPFVSIADSPPHLGEVIGTNRCRLGIVERGGLLVVFSAIDNLVKGAAGQVIQNLNIILGHGETTGLDEPGRWPG
jgi:N-acetyl-gamma-glutamyl-phosphate reductase